jgi:cobalamin biosynthesis protein CobT
LAKQRLTNIPKQISTTLNCVNKTISNNQSLKININSNIILEKDDTLNLPSISSIFNFDDMRGASDSFALKKKHHNEKLLNQITNQNIDIKEEIIFLERIRYEYQGSQNYLGIKRNIQKKWLKRLEGIKLKKQSDLLDLLLFTLTHFFLDASNGKIWNKKNEHLKKLTKYTNI